MLVNNFPIKLADPWNIIVGTSSNYCWLIIYWLYYIFNYQVPLTCYNLTIRQPSANQWPPQPLNYHALSIVSSCSAEAIYGQHDPMTDAVLVPGALPNLCWTAFRSGWKSLSDQPPCPAKVCKQYVNQRFSYRFDVNLSSNLWAMGIMIRSPKAHPNADLMRPEPVVSHSKHNCLTPNTVGFQADSLKSCLDFKIRLVFKWPSAVFGWNLVVLVGFFWCPRNAAGAEAGSLLQGDQGAVSNGGPALDAWYSNWWGPTWHCSKEQFSIRFFDVFC